MGSYRERPHSFQDALRVTREILGASPELVEKDSILAEAEQLVLAAYRVHSGKYLSRLELLSRAADRFPEVAADRLLIWAAARAEGKPLQHLTGVQVFLDHEYEVGPDVLVPRPETEVLVVTALGELRKRSQGPVLGLEIGIGSGVLSIELLSVFPALSMVASELTCEAMARAHANAARILEEGAPRLTIVQAKAPLEVWQPFSGVLGQRQADFIISNPPYLISSDPVEKEVHRHEPATALYAPASDPIHFYREIAAHSGPFLKRGGQVFLELATERSNEVLAVFKAHGWSPQLLPDLTGRDRVLVASFSGTG